MRMKFYYSPQQGMTLIETLVAVFIFSISLVSLMVISARGIQSITIASQRATAQFLAQEGIELIEAIRDDNFINTNATQWTEGLEDCFGNKCYISAYDFSMGYQNHPTICSGQCPVFRVEPTLGYQYAEGQLTPFFRTLVLYGEASDPFIRIISTVEWERSGIPYSVDVEKYITNWFQSNPA